MSRRIKPDRRNVVDRGTVFEIIRIVEQHGVPEELVEMMTQVRDFLLRSSWRINDEDFRHDYDREYMSHDLCYFGENIDWTLKKYRLITDDDPPEFW